VVLWCCDHISAIAVLVLSCTCGSSIVHGAKSWASIYRLTCCLIGGCSTREWIDTLTYGRVWSRASLIGYSSRSLGIGITRICWAGSCGLTAVARHCPTGCVVHLRLICLISGGCWRRLKEKW
jgi:hypothetical protein